MLTQLAICFTATLGRESTIKLTLVRRHGARYKVAKSEEQVIEEFDDAVNMGVVELK